MSKTFEEILAPKPVVRPRMEEGNLCPRIAQRVADFHAHGIQSAEIGVICE